MAKHQMSRTERDDLIRIVRLREAQAVDDMRARLAAIEADGEAQIAASYPENHPAWADLAAAAAQFVQETDQKILEICRQMGIRDEFRPSLYVGWRSRGENGFSERRTELRRVLKAQLERLERETVRTIKGQTRALQSRLLAGGLETEEARLFLDSLPSAEQLLPGISLQDLEQEVGALHAGREW